MSSSEDDVNFAYQYLQRRKQRSTKCWVHPFKAETHIAVPSPCQHTDVLRRQRKIRHLNVVDDIEDNTELRRGIPVAHKIYSVGATITTINYAEHIAVEKCLLLDHPQAIKIFTKRLLQAVRGNGTDCYWRDNFTCPTEEEHCQAGEMSAGYFLMCVELMQLFSKNKQDFSKLVYTLGQYYQTRNDYLNLCSEKYMRENKLYCEDITEGKFSFPIIHAIHTSPNSKEIQDILKQRTKDVQLIKRCVSLIEENGSFQYTKKRLDRLLGTCLDEVKKFGGNPMLEKFIAEISVKDR